MKKFLIVLMAFMLVFALVVGCDNSTTTKNPPTSPGDDDDDDDDVTPFVTKLTLDGGETNQYTFDGDDFDLFLSAKYIVFKSTFDSNAWGMAGMQFAVSGDGTNSWTRDPILNTEDWVNFDQSKGVYTVINLGKFDNFAAIGKDNTATKIQFAINYGVDNLGTFTAYITNNDLSSKPAGAVDIKAKVDGAGTDVGVIGYFSDTISITLPD